MTWGLIALAAALVIALATGLTWRHGNGRMRAPAGAVEAVPGTEAGPRAGTAPAGPAAPVLTAEHLGQPLGERATLVQFSTAFCAPCRATRRILADVAGMVDGVTHVEIDAEAHLDLVGSLGILRTPTVLVLGPGGEITRRASGQPRKADVIAALGAVKA
jgi:thiol-disulfide isomerase/thioredoxin